MHIVSNIEGDASEGLDPSTSSWPPSPPAPSRAPPRSAPCGSSTSWRPSSAGIGYGGGAGYISANGTVDTCIVLRTALIKDGRIYVQSGGGLVANSEPDAEYDETLHKARAVIRAAEESWRVG